MWGTNTWHYVNRDKSSQGLFSKCLDVSPNGKKIFASAGG